MNAIVMNTVITNTTPPATKKTKTFNVTHSITCLHDVTSLKVIGNAIRTLAAIEPWGERGLWRFGTLQLFTWWYMVGRKGVSLDTLSAPSWSKATFKQLEKRMAIGLMTCQQTPISRNDHCSPSPNTFTACYSLHQERYAVPVQATQQVRICFIRLPFPATSCTLQPTRTVSEAMAPAPQKFWFQLFQNPAFIFIMQESRCFWTFLNGALTARCI